MVIWGEVLVLLVVDEVGLFEEVEKYMCCLVGVEINVVIGLVCLGLKVGWVSWVGNDVFGCFICKWVV